MPRIFKYRARDVQGRLITGNMEAESLQSLLKHLLREGLFLLNVKEDSGFNLRKYIGCPRGVNRRELALFTRQMMTMVRAGVPILRCLHVLKEQASYPGFKEVIDKTSTQVQMGLPLWQALSHHPRYFSHFYVQVVKSGEMGGMLNEALEYLAGYLEREHEIISKLKNSLLYPGLVAIFTLAVVSFLVVFIIPTYESVFTNAGASLPLPTRALLAASSFVKTNLVWVSLLVFILIVVLRAGSRKAETGRVIDGFILRIPLMGKLEGHLTAARFARTMGTLIKSGVPLLSSLEIAEEVVGNRAVARGIREARYHIQEGKAISSPLRATGVFEPMVIQMIAVGEETGALDQMLVKVAEYYEKELVGMVDTLITLLEPVLIVVMALLVGFVVTSTILPLFDLMTVIR